MDDMGVPHVRKPPKMDDIGILDPWQFRESLGKMYND